MVAGAMGRSVSTMQALRWMVALISVYLGALAIVHLVKPDAVTVPSEYGYRLVGLTQNPNQLALYLAPFPFLVIFLITRSRTLAGRVLLLGALVLGILASRAIASDALEFAWIVGVVALVLGARMLPGEEQKLWRGTWVTVTAAIVISWSASVLLNRFLAPDAQPEATQRWRSVERVLDPSAGKEFANNEWERKQVRTRLRLWRSSMQVVSLSPIVGFGPGRHAGADGAFQGDEAHNSFLDLATMAGIPGALLLVWLFLAVGRPHRSMHDTQYAGCVILLTLAAYASFHLVIRQPVFWFYVLLAGALVRTER
jgi:O-antigen ligase